jgi:leader peptidase (prepilin peptidase)/N-methyltransferase
VELVVACALLGAVVGWLLARPAYRLSVASRGRSRAGCATCGRRFPAGLPGWLAVRHRCPSCRARLGPAPLLLCLVAALACAGLGWRFAGSAALPAFLLLALVGPLLAAVDVACSRLPEVLTLPTAAGTAALFGAAAAATGGWATLGRAAAAAGALCCGYLLLAATSGNRLGGGDVTLAGVLGLALGWVSWPAVLLGALLPWLVHAPFALRAGLDRRPGRRTELPFGPALLAGAYLTLLGPAVLAALLAD